MVRLCQGSFDYADELNTLGLEITKKSLRSRM